MDPDVNWRNARSSSDAVSRIRVLFLLAGDDDGLDDGLDDAAAAAAEKNHDDIYPTTPPVDDGSFGTSLLKVWVLRHSRSGGHLWLRNQTVGSET